MAKTASKVMVAACAGVLATALLAGCATQQSTVTEEQQANRNYMATVNQTMESVGTTLESFNDAVSREDVVTMRTQANNVQKQLDELSALEAPEELADVQADYVAGSQSLKAALDSYVDLYSEIENATDANPFDWSSYDSRIAAIQQQYDEGLEALKSGDTKASSKE